MGWIVLLAVLVLLAILPLGASVLYDAEGARVRIVAGPLKIQVFPMKKKPKKDKPKKEKTKKTKPKKSQKSAAEENTDAPKKPAPKPRPAVPGRIFFPWCGWRWIY